MGVYRFFIDICYFILVGRWCGCCVNNMMELLVFIEWFVLIFKVNINFCIFNK